MGSTALRLSLVSLVVLAVVCALAASAQSVNDGNQTGFPVFGTFHGSDLDAVNLSNGNPHIQIPIASFPQRHGQLAYKFIYDPPSYTLTYYKDPSGVYWDASIVQGEVVGGDVGWRLSSPLGWYLTYAENPISCTVACGLSTCQVNNSLKTDYALIDPDGTKHPLALSYEALDANQVPCGLGDQTTGLTLDGTGIWVQTTNAGRSAGQIILKNGTAALNNWLKESNGNTISPSADMLGRSNIVRSSGPNGSILYTVADSNGNPQTFRVDYTSINVTSNLCSLRSGLKGGTAPCYEYTSTWSVPSRLTLPNGLYYQFTWSGDGSLQRLDLATGGSIAYTYGVNLFRGTYSGAACVKTDPNCVPTTTYPSRVTVTSRAVTNNGATSTWNYAGYNGTTTVTDPLGNQEVHTFGYGVDSTFETQVKYYQGSSSAGTLLRTINKDYTSEPSPLAVASIINARVIRETTILQNGLTKKTETDYETSTASCSPDACPQLSTYTTTRLNPVEVREFDWGAGAPGPLLRRVDTAYLHNSNSAYLNLNIADRPASVTVYDGAGNIVSQSANSYDQGSLTGTSGATGHDYTNFGASFTTRGNLTQESHWRNTDGAWLSTRHTYDDLGNLRSTTDANGNVTNSSYDDNWFGSGCVPAAVNTQAYATQVTNALGQKNKTTYYPCTGLAQAHQDQNDINAGRSGTTFAYDLMSRLVAINSPDGGQASFDHHNDALPLKVTKTVQATPNPSIISSTLFDSLGRPVQTSLDSDPASGDVIDTTYDTLGRVSGVSNPHRSAGSSTDGITTTTYDALGRIIKVTKQDGSVSTVAYSGNCTTTTDEASKQRKACSDALGRLATVWEDPAGLNYETDYAYDALGNLIKVTQNGSNLANARVRTFT